MRIALWGAFDVEDCGRLAVHRVVAAGLLRRLPGAVVTPFAPLGRLRPLAVDAGRAVEPLAGLVNAEIAERFDCILVCGEDTLVGPERSAELWGDPAAATPFMDGLGAPLEEECPVIWAGVSLPAGPDPVTAERLRAAAPRRGPAAVLDPGSRLRLADAGATGEHEVLPPAALLLPRLFDPGLLECRAGFLRLMGWMWEPGPVITVVGDGRLLGTVGALAQSLLAVVESGAAAVQLAASGRHAGQLEFADALERALGGRCRRLPGVATIEDLAAVVAASSALLGPPGVGLWLACALGVPAAATTTGDHSELLTGLGVVEVPSSGPAAGLARLLDPRSPRPEPSADIARLDRYLDRLAGLALGSALRRAGGAMAPAPGVEAGAALRTAHEALGRQLLAERRTFQSEREAAVRTLEAELRDARDQADRLRSELAAARAANDQIVGSRTWRYSQPVRDTLARVRERRR